MRLAKFAVACDELSCYKILRVLYGRAKNYKNL